ncbi:MAG: universal stress protein [Anaerovoracaceae bacterium]|jgi:K+-sensing histidine kinase KdpD|nr:universal stress protein [Bacillota bacterium]
MSKNIMVCVTQQKTCDRLINYGFQLLEETKGELYIIHVAHYEFKFLGNTEEGEALDYLYEKALEYGANLTVVRSNHVLDTLIDLVEKNKIGHLVLGQSGESNDGNNMVSMLEERLSKKTEILVVPS